MKTFIISMSLFAVVLAYVALRSPFNKTETAKSAGAETKVDKGQTDETGQSTFAAYRKTQSASAEDWATVNAIAAQYTPVLKVLEAERNQLERTPSNGGSIIPEVQAEIDAKRFAWDMAQKAIRNKERELWKEISPYLSKYELREYKLEHSQMARDLREESVWLEPSEGEFLALYTYCEKMNDLLDYKCGGDTKKQVDWEYSTREKLHAIMFPSYKSTEEKMREWNTLKGEDVEWLRASLEVLKSATIRSERWNEFQSGPGPEGRAMMALDREERRLEELYANGQITAAELEVGQLKLIRQDEINMFREDGDEEMAREAEQELQEEIESLLAERAKEAEVQSVELPKGNEREGTP